ncbi:MAG TPA: hypothetical protein VGC96_07200, partial [Candidatus Elarobacter sp.]
MLRTEPAMAALRRRYRADDDGKTLLALVDAALAGDPALKEIIHRCDLQGEDRLSVARSLHFSERQFHRYRSFAIEAVAAEIDRVTGADGGFTADQQLLAAVSAIDPERAQSLLQSVALQSQAQRLMGLRLKVETGGVPSDGDLAPFDDAHRPHAEVLRALGLENAGQYAGADRVVAELHARLQAPRDREARAAAFELTILRRLQARRRGTIAELAAAVADMAPFATSDADTIRAAIGRAHVAIHDRRVADWQDRIAVAKRGVAASPDVRLLRYVTMVEGYLAFVRR